MQLISKRRPLSCKREYRQCEHRGSVERAAHTRWSDAPGRRFAESGVDRAIVGAAGATVVGLAGVAGAISYSHMAELARLHGEVGWRSHAFPVSVDGIEVVASLVLRAHRRAGTRAGWLPWAAL